MQKKLTFFLLLGLSPLLSNENFSVDAGIGVGYRHDQYKSAFFDPLSPDDPNLKTPVLKESGHHIRSVAMEGFVKMFIVKYIFFRFDADYAWPQSGNIHETPVVVFGPDVNLAFPTTTKIRGGKLYDILGAGGLSFNLLPSGIDQKLLIIPQAGYSLHYQRITKKSTAPTTEFFAPISVDLTMDQNLNKSALRTTWKGAFVGGDISTDPSKCFYAEAGYLFHFLTFNYKTHFVDDLIIPGIGTIVFESFWNAKVKDAYAHQARGKIGFCFSKHWKIGLSGNYYFLNGRKDKTIHFSSITTINGEPSIAKRPMKFSYNQHSYSIFADLIYNY